MNPSEAIPGTRISEDAGGVVLALDVGTSSVRCLSFFPDGTQHHAIAFSRSHRPRMTPDGGSELDPEALLEDTLACLGEASQAALAQQRTILAVGVCTFWHALMACDGEGGPLTPLYLWNDMRASASAEVLRSQLDGTDVHRRTGCVLHPSYLPARLAWLRETRGEDFRRAAMFLSFGEFLEWRLFGKVRIGHSMASGTGLFDQTGLDWDGELMAHLELTPERLAPLQAGHLPLKGLQGDIVNRLPALAEVPFFPALGDGACSNLGSGATRPGQGALMIGTSAAMRIFHASPPRTGPPPGLWRYRLDARRALTGGALSNGGNVLFRLQDWLRVPEDPHQFDALLAGREPAGHGLVVLPFLFGERNPDYPLDATGAILGLRGAHEPLDIAQACLEAVAYRLAGIADLLDPIEGGVVEWTEPEVTKQSEPEVTEWIASGGLLELPNWMGVICDVLGKPLVVSTVQEASARGAALMALEGLGIVKDAHTLPAPLGERIEPDPARHAAYRRARQEHERAYAELV